MLLSAICFIGSSQPLPLVSSSIGMIARYWPGQYGVTVALVRPQYAKNPIAQKPKQKCFTQQRANGFVDAVRRSRCRQSHPFQRKTDAPHATAKVLRRDTSKMTRTQMHARTRTRKKEVAQPHPHSVPVCTRFRFENTPNTILSSIPVWIDLCQ